MSPTKISDAMLRHLLAGKRGDDFRHAIEAEFPSVTNDEYNDALRGAWTAASERPVVLGEIFREYKEWLKWVHPEM